MNITRQQIIRILVPGIGVTAFGITAYSVTATASRLSSTTIRTHTIAAPTESSKPVAQITVNGVQVPLDSYGNASVSTGSGATVRVSAPAPESITQSSSQTPAKTFITITPGNPGQNTTSNVQDDSTHVRVNGGSSTYSSSYSSTSVFSTGDGLVQIDQSN